MFYSELVCVVISFCCFISGASVHEMAVFVPIPCAHFFSCRGRNRFVEEGFDLDLTYITERIIGMFGREGTNFVLFTWGRVKNKYVCHLICSLRRLWIGVVF